MIENLPMVRANGVALHYQRFGRGRDVVMVHGLGANLAFWALAVVPALAGDFRVTVTICAATAGARCRCPGTRAGAWPSTLTR